MQRLGTWWRTEGGGRELLRLALPLILSNSFWTLQITIDSIFLAWLSGDAVSAGFVTSLLFWTPLSVFWATAAYSSTFVAQYVGAGRPRRVGPAVWQALYFSVLTGLAFLVMVPLAGPVCALVDHPRPVQELEVIFLRCLAFTALPTLITNAVCGFFSGRGDSWTVLAINGVGLVVNALLDYALIFGHGGFPAWGIAGAGWATVTGSSASAVVGLLLLFRLRYRREFATTSGWRPERDLFARLIRFGLPSGLPLLIDGIAFTAFTVVVGWIGTTQLTSTTIAFRINLVAFLPMLGLAQAVSVLVGQRLGEDRPDVAERTTWSGCGLACLYMTTVSVLYVLRPEWFLNPFRGDDVSQWDEVAVLVPTLLYFVAVYSLLDGINLVLSFALRGGGDTRFVTLVPLTLLFPLMVLPTYAAYHFGWGLYGAWAFASLYIMGQALVFLVRFRGGRWKSMRVIEAAPVIEEPPPERPAGGWVEEVACSEGGAE
jgi:MATE family multidrug resistance protein